MFKPLIILMLILNFTACINSPQSGKYIPVNYHKDIGVIAQGPDNKVGILDSNGVEAMPFEYDILTITGKNQIFLFKTK